MAISLKDLKTVRGDGPPRGLIYGPPGIGKTSFASEWPNAVFLQTEEGTPADIEMNSFGLLETWEAVRDALYALINEEHKFNTVILDNLSRMEPIVYAEICARNNWKSIEAPGYGKGYKEADYVWAELLDLFSRLRRERGMATLYLAHSQTDRFDDPASQSYSRYLPDLHKNPLGLFEAEVDFVFLIKQEVSLQKEVSGFNRERKIAQSGEQRWIYTTPSAAWIAKNRYGIPSMVPYNKGQGFASLAPYFMAARKRTVALQSAEPAQEPAAEAQTETQTETQPATEAVAETVAA